MPIRRLLLPEVGAAKDPIRGHRTLTNCGATSTASSAVCSVGDGVVAEVVATVAVAGFSRLT